MIYEFFKNTFGDILDGFTAKDYIKIIIGTVFLFAVLWFAAAIGTAYTDHQKCLNGATGYCIESDFNTNK